MNLPPPTLPAWVKKRDGRLVPFQADEIALNVFEAAAQLGQPDVFLARELTEGALHFIASETEGAIPTTAQVADVTAKVVRELGHPALARVLLEKAALKPTVLPPAARELHICLAANLAPQQFAQRCLIAYSRQTMFSRDVLTAQEEGFLTIHGMADPLGLLGCLVGPPPLEGARIEDRGSSIFDPLAEAAAIAGRFVALDSPEWFSQGNPSIDSWLTPLAFALRLLPVTALVNCNCATPPPWADEPSPGPLFATPAASPALVQPVPFLEQLLDNLRTLAAHGRRAEVRWHLSQRDFAQHQRGQPSLHLRRLARWLLQDPALTVVFDRPRQPVRLGPGLDRRHPAALLAVSLQLPRLLELPGAGSDLALFLHKLTNLTRLALSAARQKRAFLHSHGCGPDGDLLSVNRQFLPARARLLVVPVGLEAVVRRFTRQPLCAGKDGIALARRILQHLQTVLESEGLRASLPCCLVGGGRLLVGDDGEGRPHAAGDGTDLGPAQAADIGPCDVEAPLPAQLRAAGQLHKGLDGASANLLVLPERAPTPEALADLLALAWKETEVQQLRCTRLREQRQPSFLEAGGD